MSGREGRRGLRPGLDGLEPRRLPSAALYLAAARQRLAHLAPFHPRADGADAPTPREARRERFVAKFTGTYITGPGQLESEAFRVSFTARRGGSNQFLHGAALVAINVPADSSRPISRATASLYPQNVATTGSALVLDLTAPPTTAVPTRLAWTVNGASGGLYSNAVATEPGTLSIRYIPREGLSGGYSSGDAILVFRGQILTTGTGNIARAEL